MLSEACDQPTPTRRRRLPDALVRRGWPLRNELISRDLALRSSAKSFRVVTLTNNNGGIIWRFYSRIRSSKKRGRLPRQRSQRQSTRQRLSTLPNETQNEIGFLIYHSTGCGGRKTPANSRSLVCVRSLSKPFDREQWDGTPGLANYSGTTATPGAAPTRHHAHNFFRCGDPSTRSRTRTMTKRNTLVGPQLLPRLTTCWPIRAAQSKTSGLRCSPFVTSTAEIILLFLRPRAT